MYFDNRLKRKLKEKKLSIGSWITIAHPAVAEIMANSGFEWLVIDLEHSVITIREAEELIRIIELSGVTPLVRLSSNNPVQIKRVMDAGAHGIIVPMVNSKKEALCAVEAVRYPPKGNRGVGLARAQRYGSNFNKYREWLDQNSIIIVQIEHIKAVNNIEAILSVEGIDGFIVGPYDLSGSLGIPGQFKNDLMIKTISKIKNFMKNSNKISGYHVVEPDIEQFQERIHEGYHFLAYSVDIRMIDASCRKAFEKIGDRK